MKKLPILLLFLLVSFLTYAQQDTHKRLFILLGQSNMSGRAPIENADTAALPLVKLLDADGREYLPVFHQFAVEEAYLHAKFDDFLH